MSELSVIADGDGPPVLGLHGAYSTRHEIRGFLQSLLPEHRVIYPDLPGHGDSIGVAAASAAEVVDLLDGLLDERVGDEPVTIIGHSYGAHLARGLAARRPGQVTSMLLMCPLVPGDMRAEPASVVVDDGSADALPAELRREFDGYFTVRTAATVAAFNDFVVPTLGRYDGDAVVTQLENSRLDLPQASDLSVVVAVGRRDSLVGWRQYEGLLAAYPRASAVIVADAGHALPHEHPETVRYAVGVL